MTIERGTERGGTVTTVPTDEELARSMAGEFRSGYVTAAGCRLHHVAGGEGDPLVLLPGWPQTWWEYHEVMPELASAGRRVIAVDLPGMGGSDKPESGYDKKSMAGVIREFVRVLGYDEVDIAGHDIGSQVAFSFAANHPEATRKVALLDVLHPDPSLREIPILPQRDSSFFPWWFAFNHVDGLPERLLAGRVRYLLDWVFDNFTENPAAVTELDRAVFADAYEREGAISGSNAWYATWDQDIADLGTYDKVTAPMLGLVSNMADGLFAAQMRATLPEQGTDVEVVVIPDVGHYFVEEAPRTVVDELNRFFG
ncbi:alpha/beta hydrolase [Actinophytocola sp.]|uniref:alpha/beta fold hydrolase n=1 Tax=Actinophytocola sp. TaxID=1872138 RepID=UPI002D2BE28E|nr:alpha/beta hydrolase [Actinophytocola sp.]HYQ70263.1 alpha/beta hydrolase [Actinophytocola sp.]